MLVAIYGIAFELDWVLFFWRVWVLFAAAMGSGTGAGGARRTAVPSLEPASLSQMLGAYLATEPVPFDFDTYNLKKPSEAASGGGILKSLSFIRPWLLMCPSAQVPTKQLTDALDGLVYGGALARFSPSHMVWESFNPFDVKQRRYWCQKQSGKVVVLLYHLRRLRTSPVKLTQAKASLSQQAQAELDAILRLIEVPRTSQKQAPESFPLSSPFQPPKCNFPGE